RASRRAVRADARRARRALPARPVVRSARGRRRARRCRARPHALDARGLGVALLPVRSVGAREHRAHRVVLPARCRARVPGRARWNRGARRTRTKEARVNELFRLLLVLPEQASTVAKSLDALHYVVITTSMLGAVGVTAAV